MFRNLGDRLQSMDFVKRTVSSLAHGVLYISGYGSKGSRAAGPRPEVRWYGPVHMDVHEGWLGDDNL